MFDQEIVVRNAALNWLDADKIARVIVNDGFEIIWANRAAKAALEQGRWIEERVRGFATSSGVNAAGVITDIATMGHDDLIVHSCARTGENDVLLLIRLLLGNDDEARLYGVELRRQPQEQESQYAGYRAYFGFTPAEERVLQQLLCGHNVEKCAENLDVSVDTVRSHVRQVYAKMNISSREALFHALMPFRLP